MPNQLAHELSIEASANFKKIAGPHSDVITFADVIKFNRQGPQQERVGRFLEDNFGSIENISASTNDENVIGINRKDLDFVSLLSSENQKDIDKKRLDERNKEAAKTGLEAAAICLPFGAILAISAVGVAPISLPVVVPIFSATVGVCGAAGYALGRFGTDAVYFEGQKAVDNMTW